MLRRTCLVPQGFASMVNKVGDTEILSNGRETIICKTDYLQSKQFSFHIPILLQAFYTVKSFRGVCISDTTLFCSRISIERIFSFSAEILHTCMHYAQYFL